MIIDLGNSEWLKFQHVMASVEEHSRDVATEPIRDFVMFSTWDQGTVIIDNTLEHIRYCVRGY